MTRRDIPFHEDRAFFKKCDCEVKRDVAVDHGPSGADRNFYLSNLW